MIKSHHIATLLLALLMLSFGPSAPPPLVGISTDLGLSPEQLVKQHFIKGGCRNVANISAFGDASSVGFFSNGENIIGFDSGIMLSTGQIADAAGPNSSVELSTSFDNTTGDRDLNIFATNIVFDAAGIEFDFIPLDSQVTFEYVFASEEYCEFVGSIFNDNFGFFVSGPGIEGEFFDDAINVALLPGTNEYVAINSVNHETNSALYVKNELAEDAGKCNIPFNPSFLELIEFDGFTLPLTATIDVIPCETYRIRLVVGDVGDDKLDSAVFLASKSFDLGTAVSVRAEVEGSLEPVAFESCRDGRFVFERSRDTDFNQPLQVDFTISPLSDAIPDVDFVGIPGSITIPPMAISAVLPIEVIADQIQEMPERLRLDIDYTCECLDPVQSELIIADLDSLQGTFEESIVCAGQEFTLGPTVTGGAAPYSYLWNTNETTPSLTATVTEPTHFTVTITDACGGTAPAIVAVAIQQDPRATLSDTVDYCLGDVAALSVDLGGRPPWSLTYSIDGEVQPSLTNINTNPFLLPVNSIGTYQLLRFEDAFCVGEAEGTGLVRPSGPAVDVALFPPSCPIAEDGSIEVSISDGQPPYRLEWDIETEDLFRPTGLSIGTYNLSITDGAGCLNVNQIELPPPSNVDPDCEDFRLYVPNAFSPNDDGINDLFELHADENSFIDRIESVQLYNRWGALIFETTDLLPAERVPIWDGYYKGERSDNGVFVWVVRLRLQDGRIKTVSGDVTLLD
ncbi:MAG: choice-of-anchor L domain-containing protein [Bacteroidota bacterium]